MFRVALISAKLFGVQACDEPDASALLQTLTKRDNSDAKVNDVFDLALDELAGLDNRVKDALVQRMTSPTGWAGLVDKFKTLPKASKLELLQMGSTLPELKELFSDPDVSLFEAAVH